METASDVIEPGTAVPDTPDNTAPPAATNPLALLLGSEGTVTSFSIQKHPHTPPDGPEPPPDDPSLIASFLIEAFIDLEGDRDASASILFTLEEENGDLIATAEATWEYEGETDTAGPYVAVWEDPWEWIVEHLDEIALL